MQCSSFDAGRCRSCTLLPVPYDEQLAAKQQRVRELLAGHPGLQWLPPVASAPQGFRSKAKMVVTGTPARPALGILDERGRGVDLRDCPLHTPGIQAALPVLAAFVTRAGLVPYDVPRRRGELKHVLVTESAAGELMVRFVLRSAPPIAAVRRHLGWLQQQLPGLAVASVNLQPEHKAVLEGEQEVLLTERRALTMRTGAADLRVRPRSFVQTNTPVAGALYAQVAQWVAEVDPASVWDLYCGVGGFALHVAAPGRAVTGVEASAEAVASARSSARAAGLTDVAFTAQDATAFALAAPAPPALVVVNPPRRGIGAELAGWLQDSGVRSVVYSSCNPTTLAKDLAAMPGLRPVRARLLDMFPHTDHVEVVTLLQRAA
jgi:23S rRNA (uracil747-C5)-methyltransferase